MSSGLILLLALQIFQFLLMMRYTGRAEYSSNMAPVAFGALLTLASLAFASGLALRYDSFEFLTIALIQAALCFICVACCLIDNGATRSPKRDEAQSQGPDNSNTKAFHFFIGLSICMIVLVFSRGLISPFSLSEELAITLPVVSWIANDGVAPPGLSLALKPDYLLMGLALKSFSSLIAIRSISFVCFLITLSLIYTLARVLTGNRGYSAAAVLISTSVPMLYLQASSSLSSMLQLVATMSILTTLLLVLLKQRSALLFLSGTVAVGLLISSGHRFLLPALTYQSFLIGVSIKLLLKENQHRPIMGLLAGIPFLLCSMPFLQEASGSGVFPRADMLPGEVYLVQELSPRTQSLDAGILLNHWASVDLKSWNRLGLYGSSIPSLANGMILSRSHGLFADNPDGGWGLFWVGLGGLLLFAALFGSLTLLLKDRNNLLVRQVFALCFGSALIFVFSWPAVTAIELIYMPIIALIIWLIIIQHAMKRSEIIASCLLLTGGMALVFDFLTLVTLDRAWETSARYHEYDKFKLDSPADFYHWSRPDSELAELLLYLQMINPKGDAYYSFYFKDEKFAPGLMIDRKGSIRSLDLRLTEEISGDDSDTKTYLTPPHSKRAIAGVITGKGVPPEIEDKLSRNQMKLILGGSDSKALYEGSTEQYKLYIHAPDIPGEYPRPFWIEEDEIESIEVDDF